jgi:predicted metallopeptidase
MKRKKYEIAPAPDIDHIIKEVLPHLPFDYIDVERIVCMRSIGATSRARARIWSFPKIWQMALQKPAHYIIEVLSQHFDHLSLDDQTRVVIHELMHIPKNFSGALVPHRGIHKHIDHGTVETLFKQYRNAKRK